MENTEISNLLIEKFISSEEYKSFDLNTVKNIYGIKGGADALFFAALFKDKNKSLMIIKEDENEAMLLSQSLNFYNIENYYFPDYDSVPFTKMSPITDIVQDRLSILYKLINEDKFILITTIKSIARKLSNKEILKNNTINIKVNDKLNIDSLRLNLYDFGYVIEREVSEVGTCAVRGSIIDIYSILYNNPIRIELFDDEVESIRFFNIEDGKSYKNIEEITIYPVREAIYKDSLIEEVLNKNIDSELKDNIQKSKYFAGSENLLGVFNNDLQTIFDYANESIIFTDDDLKLKNKLINVLSTTEENFNDIDNIFKSLYDDINSLYIDINYFENISKNAINLSPFIVDNNIHKFSFEEGVSFKSKLTEFLDYIKDYRKKDYFIILSTSHYDQAKRFYKIMDNLEPKLITSEENNDDEENKIIEENNIIDNEEN